MRFGFDHVLSVACVQEQARDLRHPVDARCRSSHDLAVSGANPFNPGSMSGCEKGFERYQSPCNMKYDRSRFGFWNGKRWRHPTM
jgi:hypothetical protein